jgi:hypothetical protein
LSHGSAWNPRSTRGRLRAWFSWPEAHLAAERRLELAGLLGLAQEAALVVVDRPSAPRSRPSIAVGSTGMCAPIPLAAPDLAGT